MSHAVIANRKIYSVEHPPLLYSAPAVFSHNAVTATNPRADPYPSRFGAHAHDGKSCIDSSLSGRPAFLSAVSTASFSI
jgi:hypothetical protein